MFDLNRAIGAWKSSFARQRACSQDELDELESHLREGIEELIDQGVAEPDAFAEAVDRIGAPPDVCGEFAKNDRPLRLDKLALRVNKVLILAAACGGLVPGILAIRRGDALLGMHVASITSAYVVAILSALVGTYAIVRSVCVQDANGGFRDRLVQQSRWLLGLIASLTAVGFVLGACWWHAKTGNFVDGNSKEIGAIAVFGFAMVFFLSTKRGRIGARRLGQFALAMSLVTLASWFGPIMLR
jgi:hypothetical protein